MQFAPTWSNNILFQIFKILSGIIGGEKALVFIGGDNIAVFLGDLLESGHLLFQPLTYKDRAGGAIIESFLLNAMPDFAIFIEESGVFIISGKAAVAIDIGRVNSEIVIFEPEIADLLPISIVFNIIFVGETLAADKTAAGNYFFHGILPGLPVISLTGLRRNLVDAIYCFLYIHSNSFVYPNLSQNLTVSIFFAATRSSSCSTFLL
jgi:hypothetical protein